MVPAQALSRAVAVCPDPVTKFHDLRDEVRVRHSTEIWIQWHRPIEESPVGYLWVATESVFVAVWPCAPFAVS